MALIFVLTKSSCFGSKKLLEYRGWYRECMKALELVDVLTDSKIIVASSVKIGSKKEIDCYRFAFRRLGIENSSVEFFDYGFETISQLDFAFVMAQKRNEELIIISTLFHFPRAWWLSRNCPVKIKHKIVFGITDIKEVLVDIALDFIFPIIDVLGCRKWFQNLTIERRQSGLRF